MGTSVESQAYIFFSTLYGGLIIGFIYDLYRIFRYFFKPKKVATFIEDLIFWIIVSVIALIILFYSNWGEIRGYVFLGFISGAILYSKLLSKPVITFLVHIINFIIKILKFILNIFGYPFKLIWDYIHTPYMKALGKIKKGNRKLKRILKLPYRVMKDAAKYINMISQKK